MISIDEAKALAEETIKAREAWMTATDKVVSARALVQTLMHRELARKREDQVTHSRFWAAFECLLVPEAEVIAQAPHCDPWVLHEPTKCRFCDMYPKRQAMRVEWGVAFTGGPPARLPCPSELLRPVGMIERWHGNRPEKEE